MLLLLGSKARNNSKYTDISIDMLSFIDYLKKEPDDLCQIAEYLPRHKEVAG